MFPRLSITRIIFFILLSLLMISGSYIPVEAEDGGHFKKLYFSDSTPQKCGGWYVVIDPPDDRKQFVNVTGIASYKVTDARNKVVAEGTQDLKPISALSIYGMPSADWTGAVNPIRVVVKFGDRIVADLKGNNPCLPKGKPRPIAFDPLNVNVPREAIDHLAISCRRNVINVSSIDAKGRKSLLTTIKLADIIKAADAGLTKDLRRNGVIFIRGDGQGNFVITWTGGKQNADGQAANGFAKNFVCAYH